MSSSTTVYTATTTCATDTDTDNDNAAQRRVSGVVCGSTHFHLNSCLWRDGLLPVKKKYTGMHGTGSGRDKRRAERQRRMCMAGVGKHAVPTNPSLHSDVRVSKPLPSPSTATVP